MQSVPMLSRVGNRVPRRFRTRVGPAPEEQQEEEQEERFDESSDIGFGSRFDEEGQEEDDDDDDDDTDDNGDIGSSTARVLPASAANAAAAPKDEYVFGGLVLKPNEAAIRYDDDAVVGVARAAFRARMSSMDVVDGNTAPPPAWLFDFEMDDRARVFRARWGHLYEGFRISWGPTLSAGYLLGMAVAAVFLGDDELVQYLTVMVLTTAFVVLLSVVRPMLKPWKQVSVTLLMLVTAGALTVNYFTRVNVSTRSPLSITLFAVLVVALLISGLALARYTRRMRNRLRASLVEQTESRAAASQDAQGHSSSKLKDGRENESRPLGSGGDTSGAGGDVPSGLSIAGLSPRQRSVLGSRQTLSRTTSRGLHSSELPFTLGSGTSAELGQSRSRMNLEVVSSLPTLGSAEKRAENHRLKKTNVRTSRRRGSMAATRLATKLEANMTSPDLSRNLRDLRKRRDSLQSKRTTALRRSSHNRVVSRSPSYRSSHLTSDDSSASDAVLPAAVTRLKNNRRTSRRRSSISSVMRTTLS